MEVTPEVTMEVTMEVTTEVAELLKTCRQTIGRADLQKDSVVW